MGLVDPIDYKRYIFMCDNNDIENEYLGKWCARIIRPGALIVTDNRAAMYLFKKGKLPPSWIKSYRLSIIMLKTYNSPVITYIKTKEKNPADQVSRI